MIRKKCCGRKITIKRGIECSEKLINVTNQGEVRNKSDMHGYERE